MNLIAWLVLALIWSSTWIVIAIGLKDLPPITFAAARFILAIILLGSFIAIKKIPMPKGRGQWRLMAITGILQFSVNYSLVFWSEVYIPSGLAAVLQATIPVFGLPLAWAYLPNERITKLKIAAVLLGVVGVAVIFFDQLALDSPMVLAGSVAVVIGAYAAAHSSILVKAKAADIHPASLVLAQMICGLPAILIYAITVEGSPFAHNWSMTAVMCVLYLAAVGTVAAFWLYYWLLSRIESTKAMMISLVTPFLAVILGAAILGERFQPRTFIGGALIIVAVGLIVFRKKVEPASEPYEL